MILDIRCLPQAKGEAVGRVAADLFAVLEDGKADASLKESLRIQLDWIQYRSNFREPVILRPAFERGGARLPLAELAIDVRQAPAEGIREALAAALGGAAAGSAKRPDRVYLEEFGPLRKSIIWSFNRLFWQRLSAWEAASGRSFEEALPGGRSDANHPKAVADSADKFWRLLRELEGRRQLPAEAFVLEVGVGTGARARMWMDAFRRIDAEGGTGYWPRVRFLCGDLSLPILDRAAAAVEPHQDAVSLLAIEATNPFKTLSFLRYKILYVHLTNVWDTLPDDEIARRDGAWHAVEFRAFLPRAQAARIAAAAGIPEADFGRSVDGLLAIGPEALREAGRGVEFWRATWAALRLEERLVRLEALSEAGLPQGLDPSHLAELLDGIPGDLRIHLSPGAVESFVRTIPLLHPRGFLEVQDIFATRLDEAGRTFRGPGKLDGSVLDWVNGALLREVGARAGYDVHFAPFPYRPGSRTSILHTTQKE